MPYLSVEGVRIYYEDEGQGEPIVFVHGASQDTLSWHDNIGHFARRHRVVAVDLPGHGKSALVESRPTTTTAEFARFVFGAVTALGLEQPVIVGHSMGAGIGITMGLDHPDEIRGVVAVCGGAAFRGPTGVSYQPELLRYTEVNPTDWLETMFHSILGRTTPEPRRKEMAFDATRCSPYVAHADLITYTSFNFNERLHEARIPIFYLMGEDDWSTTPAMAQSTSDRLKAAGVPSECVVLDGIGHIPHWEQPGAFNEALEAVLARMAAARRAAAT